MEVVAVGGLVVLLKGVFHFGAVAVAGGDHTAGLAGQFAFVEGLHTIGALVVVSPVDPADELGGQRAFGVIALGGGDGIDAVGKAHIRNEFLYLLGDLGLHPGGKDLVGAVFGQAAGCPLRVDAQDLPQRSRHLLQFGPVVVALRLGLFPAGLAVGKGFVPPLLQLDEIRGGQYHVIHRARGGQNGAAGIDDTAPAGRDGVVPGLLLNGPLLVIFVFGDLNGIELAEQRNKGTDAEEGHQYKRPQQNRPVGPAVPGPLFLLLRPLSFPWHLPFPFRCRRA